MAQATVSHKWARLQFYLGDPCIVLVGDQASRDRNASFILWTWIAMGLKVVWRKTSKDGIADWIGAKNRLRISDQTTTLPSVPLYQ